MRSAAVAVLTGGGAVEWWAGGGWWVKVGTGVGWGHSQFGNEREKGLGKVLSSLLLLWFLKKKKMENDEVLHKIRTRAIPNFFFQKQKFGTYPGIPNAYPCFTEELGFDSTQC